MTVKLTVFAAAAAFTLLASSAFAFSPQRQDTDSCDVGGRDANCDVQTEKSNVMHMVPFSGERNQFYRDTSEAAPRHHRLHAKSQG